MQKKYLNFTCCEVNVKFKGSCTSNIPILFVIAYSIDIKYISIKFKAREWDA